MNSLATHKKTGGQAEPFAILEQSVYAALETYSNVHRGSGHFSQTTTHLFDGARKIILDHLGLSKRKYTLIFCTPYRAGLLTAKLEKSDHKVLSTADFGLPFGLRAVAVKRTALPGGVPFHTGGGSARLISGDWVVWEAAPDRFESGTPAIVNVIAFARALQLIKQSGENIFINHKSPKTSAVQILYHDDLLNFAGRDLLEKLKQNSIGSNILVPSTGGETKFINMDYAASTPSFLPVYRAVVQTWRQPAEIQREIVSEVRALCAGILGAPLSEYDILFTSNATEAINLAAESTGREIRTDIEPVVITTLLEHSSNDLPWRNVPGHSHITFPVDNEGFLNLNELEVLLREYNHDKKHGNRRIVLLALSGASNVLGSYNDLCETGKIVHRYGARMLVDGAQLVAHRKVDLQACGADYFAFSAHKVYAPFGTGVLAVKKGLLQYDAAELEKICSSGEENAAGIAALGKALSLLQRVGMDVVEAEERELTRYALQGLLQIPGIQVYGVTNTGSPRFSQKGGVIVFNLKDKMSDVVAKKLALQGGIGIRYGCHCSHVLIKHLLHVGPKLEKFQKFFVTVFPHIQLPGVARISMGPGNTHEEIDKLIKTLENISGKVPKQTKITNGRAIAIHSESEVKKQIKDFVHAATRRVYGR